MSFSVVTSNWKFSDPNPQPWREGRSVGPKLSMREQKQKVKKSFQLKQTKGLASLECDTLRGQMQLLTSQSYVCNCMHMNCDELCVYMLHGYIL